jgi:hypothetical protein
MSESYELEGKVKVVGETQVLGSGFQKRELVVTVEDGKYPQYINIEFVQDKIEKLEGLSVGTEVLVKFNLRGREYNGRYFNSLQGWFLKVLDDAKPTESTNNDMPPAPENTVDDMEEDIPF